MENLFTMPKKIIVLGSLFLLFSCAQDELLNDDSLKATPRTFIEKWSSDKLNVFKGPKVAVGNDSVRSWISVRKDTGLPNEIGIEMSPGALTGLPDYAPGVEGPTIVLPLHIKAKQLTPFKHIVLNWQNHGHGGGPTNTEFNSPHFDFHFYTISNEERLAIPDWCSCPADAAFNIYPPTTTSTTNSPVTITTGGYMPLGYATPPGQGAVYGQMGKHWLPIPFNYLPFTKVMVYGTYDGKIVFVEPMVTREYLSANPDFSAAYSQPKLFEKAGNYPSRYNIYRDSKTGNIKITLSDFLARAATPY
ncbi:hypothetical protein H4V97_001142 [Flavobacterium sp. CG_23.5]|uniref:DUF5602 domain-containing protein n=1 Tax=Flavobacterium sp. CG_23.5 TaxID=2760708 RepID=UPI001AEB86B3|nr:DUF5602 domain-containing protein [Flavobacterium sp. CG_23.5]MBP2282824.1 hypothetical protein [Flavobacterium sp. CG_23.5]